MSDDIPGDCCTDTNGDMPNAKNANTQENEKTHWYGSVWKGLLTLKWQIAI